MKDDSHVPISAVLHTFNDSRRLEECLKAILWCDEIIVVDLGSQDNCVEIAKKYAGKVLAHDWVPIADQIRNWSFSQAAHDWILCVDPDEIYPEGAETEIRKIVKEFFDTAGEIRLPMQFYFRGRPLTCCMWYPHLRNLALVNREKYHDFGQVHSGGKVSGDRVDVPWGTIAPIKHYWNDSWREFFRSHWRYVKMEGPSRYFAGKRFSFRQAWKGAWTMTRTNLIEKRGWQGGINGIGLSLAMGLYEAGAHLSLLVHQAKLKCEKKSKN